MICQWWPVSLFVVVTVATMGLHLGSPGLPGHLGPVLTSVHTVAAGGLRPVSGLSLWWPHPLSPTAGTAAPRSHVTPDVGLVTLTGRWARRPGPLSSHPPSPCALSSLWDPTFTECLMAPHIVLTHLAPPQVWKLP